MSTPEQRQGQGQPTSEGAVLSPEPVPRHELPLYGATYICIGASRPAKSIGGPTAIALASAGADVFITGGDPGKEGKAQRVLSAIEATGSENSGKGTFDVTKDVGRQALVTEIKEKYGQVDGVLYFPAGGLVGDDEEQKLAHGRALNVDAPQELIELLLKEGVIREGGIMVTTPSIYSWTFPDIQSPDPRYGPVASTKHEGELDAHAMIPDFEAAGVNLAYLVGHGIDGTFAMDYMMRQVSDDARAEVLATAEVDGERRLPTIAEMAQGAVRIATLARQGELEQGHTEFVGIAESARRVIETPHWEGEEMVRRLDVYGPEAVMLDEITIYGEGRRAIAHMLADGDRVRPILTDKFYVDENGVGHYEVTDDDTRDHFDTAKPELKALFPGIKMLALAKKMIRTNAGFYNTPFSIEEVKFMKAVYPDDKISINDQIIFDTAMNPIRSVNITNESGVSICTVDRIIYDLEEFLLTSVDSDIDPEYFIEAAAQAALLAGLRRQGIETMQDLSPLFSGIDRVTIHRTVPRGTQITIDVTTTGESRKFGGSAKVYDDQGLIMEIDGMSGLVGKRRVMNKLADKSL